MNHAHSIKFEENPTGPRENTLNTSDPAVLQHAAQRPKCVLIDRTDEGKRCDQCADECRM